MTLDSKTRVCCHVLDTIQSVGQKQTVGCVLLFYLSWLYISEATMTRKLLACCGAELWSIRRYSTMGCNHDGCKGDTLVG